MNHNYLILALLLALASCRDQITYTGVEPPETRELGDATLLNGTHLFATPIKMLIVDTLLIVQDYYQRDTCFWIFDKRAGDFLAAFGLKGRGPGELIYPTGMTYDRENRLLVTRVPNLKKIARYDLAKILSGEKEFYSEVSIDSALFIRNVIPCAGAYLATEISDTSRFRILRDGRLKTAYTSFPRLVADKEENWALFEYASQWEIKPDQTKMVHATYIGAIMEIFDIKNDRLEPTAIRYLHEPIYRPYDSVSPRWVATTDDTVCGFVQLVATDNRVYAILVGEAYPPDATRALNKIFVFDWTGLPLARYALPSGLTPECIAVEDDETHLYAIATDDNMEAFLYRYSIPPAKKILHALETN
jgi:hypothetical protein